MDDLLHTCPEARASTDDFCPRHIIKCSDDFSDKGLCCVERSSIDILLDPGPH